MDNKRISEIVEEEMIKQDANRYRDMRKILTIPKSIADWLDKAFEKYHDENSLASTTLSLCIFRDISKHDNIEKWFMQHNMDRLNLALIYLAGKALGVDLVKVVEG